MADLPPVTVEITANITQFTAAIAQVQKSLAELGVQSQKTSQQQSEASNNAARAAKSSASQIESSNKKAESSFKNLGNAANAAFVTLGAARSGNYFYAFAAGSQFLNKFTGDLAGASTGMKVLGGAGIAAALGITAVATAGAALFASAKAPIEMAANFQVLKIQLEGLLGSAQRANAEFKFLTDLGQKSIVPTQSLIEADRQLLAFGVSSDTTRRQLVQFFSDFGTATSASTQQIYFMSLALGQVSAAGKANMVDLRQLANAGVNLGDLYQIVGDHIGKSAQSVSESVKDGIFTAPVLFAALNEYGKKYGETAEKARNSTQGILANIKDIVEVGFGTAFAGLNEQISVVLKSVQGLVQRIDFNGLAAGFQTAFNQISASLQGIDWNGLLRFFNEYLPKAIAITGAVIGSFISTVRAAVSVVNIMGQSVYVFVQAIIRAFAEAGIAVTNFNDFLGQVSDEQADIDRRKWSAMRDNATKEMANAKITFGKTMDDLRAISSVPIDITVRVVKEDSYDRALANRFQAARDTGQNVIDSKPFDWSKMMNLTGLGSSASKAKQTFTDLKATFTDFGNNVTQTMAKIPHVTSEVASEIRDRYQTLVNSQKAILDNFLTYANGYYNKMVGYLDLGKAFGDANDAKKRAADAQKALDRSLADQQKAIAKAQDQYAETVTKTQASIDKSTRDAQQKLVAAQANLADKQRQTDTQTAQIQMDLALKVSALRNGLESRHHASRLLYDMDAARTQDQINQAQIDAAARLNALQESLQTGSAADAVAKAQQDLTDLAADSADKLASAKMQADETLASVVESQRETVSQAQVAYDEAASAAAVSYVDRFKQQIADVKNWLDVSSRLLQSGVKQALVDQIGSQGPAAGTELGNQLLSDQGLLGTLKEDWHTITEGVAATATALYEQFGQETGGFLGTTTGQATVQALTVKMQDAANAWKAMVQRMYHTTITIDVQYNMPPPPTAPTIPSGMRGFAEGGYVPTTAPALVHAGEFVLSNAMLAGQQPIPNQVKAAVSNVDNSRNANITVNAMTNADPHMIGKEIAWAIRTSV